MKYFIFEGSDCVGKTTLIKEVASQLEPGTFIVVKEPGGFNALLKEGFDPAMCGGAYPSFREMCVNDMRMPEDARRAAFLADSLYQYHHTIEPALKIGTIILSDRSWLSDLAYGSVLTKIPIQNLHTFNNILLKRPKSHVFFLTLSNMLKKKRYGFSNRMDSVVYEKADELDEAYRKIFKLYFQEEEVTEVSTAHPVEVLAKEIVKRILGTS